MSKDIKWSIKEADIRWTYLNKEKKCAVVEFEEDMALAHLIMNGVIFTNSHHWEKEWPEAAREATALCVLCNDVFAWGTADAETIAHHEIQELYAYWEKDFVWGTAIWAIRNRKCKPQKPVEDLIRKACIWDIDGIYKELGL